MDRIITPPGVEVRNNTLRIVFMYKNIRCRETLNLKPTKANIKYAANLRAEILSKIARNEFNYRDYFPDSKLAIRLGIIKEIKLYNCTDLLEQQLSNYAKMVENSYMSPSTFDTYRKIIKGILIPYFGRYDIKDISAPIIRAWIISIKLAPKTIRNYLGPLRNLFTDAINDDLIKENPLDQIALTKLIQVNSTRSSYEIHPFSTDEKQLIIDMATGQLKNLIQFGFWSGLRISELIALKWSDINFNDKAANVSRAKVCNVEKTTKTKAGTRTLILLPKAIESLNNQLIYTQDDDYVFHNSVTNKAWSSSKKVAEYWRDLLSRVNVKYRNCYQMRHTYASTLLSNGENPWWVATQMGHVDVEMIFKRYGKWIPNSDKNSYTFTGKY